MLFLDLLRGSAFFPFVVLIAGVFSKPLLEELAKANATTLFLAGVIGAFAVFNSDRWIMSYIKENFDDLE
jgi:hypothetical protein